MLILNGLIGEGGFGKVLTAKYDVTQQWHAVKEITKVFILDHSFDVPSQLDFVARVGQAQDWSFNAYGRATCFKES